LSAIEENSAGGRGLTRTVVPIREPETLLRAQPGSASRTAGSTGSPRINATAPASAAPSAIVAE